MLINHEHFLSSILVFLNYENGLTTILKHYFAVEFLKYSLDTTAKTNFKLHKQCKIRPYAKWSIADSNR